MKKVIRKAVAAVMALSMLMTFTACGKEKIDNDNIKISNLSQFKIVYSSKYEEWQMEEVKVLQDVIEHLTGKKIDAVSDETEKGEHEIILASSKRETHVSNTVKGFKSELDYVISVAEGNIVLGGNSYYGDMRAVYDFVNNYLGYDDLEGKYIQEQNKDAEKKDKSDDEKAEDDAEEQKKIEEIKGTKTVLYTEPLYDIVVENPGEYPFAEVKNVKLLSDASFNLVKLDTMKFNSETIRTYSKWCARFGVRILQQAVYNIRTNKFVTNEEEFMSTCPIVYGHIVNIIGADGLAGVDIGDVYKEQYSKYGWKIVANFSSSTYDEESEESPFKEIFDNKDAYKSIDVISLNHDISFGNTGGFREDFKHLNVIDQFKKMADRNGSEFWFSAYSGKKYNEKMYQWDAYIGLAFGANGIKYSTLKKAVLLNDDYSKTKNYEIAKLANEEILSVVEASSYNDYKYIGADSIGYSELDNFGVINDPYEKFNEKISFNDKYVKNPYTVGCFEAKDGSGKIAYMFVNIAELQDGGSISLPVPFNVNAKKVTLIKANEKTDLIKDETGLFEGYYKLSAENGKGAFIVVE